jgi:hypothetical protein
MDAVYYCDIVIFSSKIHMFRRKFIKCAGVFWLVKSGSVSRAAHLRRLAPDRVHVGPDPPTWNTVCAHILTTIMNHKSKASPVFFVVVPNHTLEENYICRFPDQTILSQGWSFSTRVPRYVLWEVTSKNKVVFCFALVKSFCHWTEKNVKSFLESGGGIMHNFSGMGQGNSSRLKFFLLYALVVNISTVYV